MRSLARPSVALAMHRISPFVEVMPSATVWDGEPVKKKKKRTGNRIKAEDKVYEEGKTRRGNVICTAHQTEGGCVDHACQLDHQCTKCRQKGHGSAHCIGGVAKGWQQKGSYQSAKGKGKGKGKKGGKKGKQW